MDGAKYTSIDLFAGAGGMTQGFREQGFVPLYANDHEEPAIETYARNHPEAKISSAGIETIDPVFVRKQLELEPGELDVLIGGPPCQGFSTYGQRDVDDHRNRLYEHYLHFLEAFRPKAFVIENVTGILSICQGKIINDIVSRLNKLGYGSRVTTLDAVSFGVPQYRKRVFIFGGETGQELPVPRPTHGQREAGGDSVKQGQFSWFAEDGLQPILTTRDAISDLPDEVFLPRLTHQVMPYPKAKSLTGYQEEMRGGCKELTYHSAKQMLGIRRLRLALMRPGDYGTKIRARLQKHGLPGKLIKELLGGNGLRDSTECRTEDREKEKKLRELLHNGHADIDEILESLDSGGFANKYRRLKWDEPSHTLVAHMARDCSDFVHPDIDRFISVREAARLQSFPDSYYFPGSQFRQLRQIGNAVPPKLAESIAREVARFLDSCGQSASRRKRVNASAAGSNVAR